MQVLSSPWDIGRVCSGVQIRPNCSLILLPRAKLEITQNLFFLIYIRTMTQNPNYTRFDQDLNYCVCICCFFYFLFLRILGWVSLLCVFSLIPTYNGLILSLSGGFTPCRYLSSSSGREYVQSYNLFSPMMMITWIKLRENLLPGPTLFDTWHGIFYMASCTDTAWHTKAFDNPVMDHLGGGVKALRHKADLNRRPVGRQSNTPTTRPWWPPQVWGSIIPRVLKGGGALLSNGGSLSLYYNMYNHVYNK